MKFVLKSTITKKLKKNEIINICKLKDTHWKYGYKSQIKWFNTNMKANDIHNLAYLKKRLIGYVSLRKRNFIQKNKKKKYLYFDTLIVLKKYRKFKIGNKLLNLTTNIIKRSKLHSMLICKKKISPFYEKYEWQKILQKNSQILDHKHLKNLSMMCFNRTEKISKYKTKYYIFS